MSDLIVSDKGGTFERELPPPGPTLAVCWKVFNVGMQPNPRGNPQHKVVIYWELPYRYARGDYKGKKMLISQMYTASLNEKAYLRRDLEAWAGKPLTETQLKGFDLNSLVGHSCMIQVVHKDGFANVQTIMAKPVGMTPESLETDPDYLPIRITNLLAKQLATEEVTTLAEKGFNKATGPGPQGTEKDLEIY